MMKKLSVFLLCVLVLNACSKRDPILPGERADIFDSYEVNVKNKELPDLGAGTTDISGDKICDYRQDAQNVIWKADKKIWSGFSTNNAVKSEQSPICDGKFIYAGLSTGEVVKINTSNGRLVWEEDVYRVNNLTGGASMVDIVAHVGIDGKYVYAGGLGDAFCKLNASDGNKVWCLNISVPVDFIMVDDFIFVVGTDSNLYAINKSNGDIYWKAEIEKQVKPKYDGKDIIIGSQKIDYKNGLIKKSSWF